jgi:hypothetical protein
MRALSWVGLAIVGWGVMMAAYMTRGQSTPVSPWAAGLTVVGPELPAEFGQTVLATRVRVRLLPAISRTEAILTAMKQLAKDKVAGLELQLRPKLFMLPFDMAGIDARSLQSGRLPDAGGAEVIAGSKALHTDRLTVGDRELSVVGFLKPEFALLGSDYLTHPSDKTDVLFPRDDPSVHAATLVQLTPAQAHDRHFLQQLDKSLPSPKYAFVMPQERLEPVAYYTYLGGLAALLLGGSGALIGLFRKLAIWARRPPGSAGDEPLDGLVEPVTATTSPGWWAAPLLEMEKRPRLVWAVHLVYFGLVIAGSVLIYNLPDIQTVLLSNVRDALSASSGPLASAAKAYASGSIARAAVVTFVINFFLGSLLMLTLPSIIVPGSGILMAGLRSLLWGVLLAPSLTVLAYSMLPHSGTMLLEGEGYILATLFGLLVPIHIFQSSLGGTPLTRFGRVLLLNVQANVWVALVLAVAACYEATEVILMNR